MLYFIAILAPPEINQQVLEWKQYMLQQFGCKVALRSPAHITLIAPFNMHEQQENEMINLLQQFAATQTGFPVILKNFDAFKPRVIFVHVKGSPALEQLQKHTETMLLQNGRFNIKKEERPFHPHITIANRDLQKHDFPAAWQYFQHLEYEATFNADNLSLLKHNQHHWEVAVSCALHN